MATAESTWVRSRTGVVLKLSELEANVVLAALEDVDPGSSLGDKVRPIRIALSAELAE